MVVRTAPPIRAHTPTESASAATSSRGTLLPEGARRSVPLPNTLCTDHGRAINQAEPGWEKTLTGLPKELYAFWDHHLRPRGYKLRCQIVDFPGGMPGDVAMSLIWG